MWASAIGLALDIIGFLILAYEWHKAVNEAEQADIAIELDRAEGAKWGRNEAEMEAVRPGIIAGVRRHHRSRKWVFRLGAFLIVAGFARQLLGSWPQG